MKQVTSAIATSKRISRMHAILLWRFSDDILKFVDDSSVSAFANNADMRLCSCVCLCVCACMCGRTYVFVFCVRVRKVCALRKILQALQELCISDDLPSAQLYSCGFVFLLPPPSASSLSSESFVLNFPVCAWLLCC